jgi:hypothetical protein
MFNYIEQLRKKPIAYRKRVLLLTTSILTGLVVLIWLSTFSLNLGSTDVDSAVIKDQLKPIDAIKTNAASFFDTIKSMSVSIFGTDATTSSN